MNLASPLSSSPAFRSPQWVAFDAVGTLIHPEPGVAEAYHSSAARHGSRLSAEEIAHRFRMVYSEFEELPPERAETSEERELAKWREIVSRVIPDLKAPEECFRDLFEWFSHPQAWRVYPDVAEALERLWATGMQVALASNFDRRLHQVCDGLPGLDRIRVRVVSSEVGWRKPSAGFYRALVSQTGVDPSEIVMIGDSWLNDIAGAREAGLQALWLDRRGPSSTSDRMRTLAVAVDEVLWRRRTCEGTA
jgi:putative hydrolase of the HAD superfamily